MSTSASGRVVEAMEGKLESLCLAKECRACRELEEVFGLKLTDGILNEREMGVCYENETEAG